MMKDQVIAVKVFRLRVRRPDFQLYSYPQVIYVSMSNLTKYLQFTLL